MLLSGSYHQQKSSCNKTQGDNNIIELPPKYKALRPISTKKYIGLCNLCRKLVIPEEFHQFYSNLNNTKDPDDSEDFYDYYKEDNFLI